MCSNDLDVIEDPYELYEKASLIVQQNTNKFNHKEHLHQKHGIVMRRYSHVLMKLKNLQITFTQKLRSPKMHQSFSQQYMALR
jgi:hypothetical protein